MKIVLDIDETKITTATVVDQNKIGAAIVGLAIDCWDHADIENLARVGIRVELPDVTGVED